MPVSARQFKEFLLVEILMSLKTQNQRSNKKTIKIL